MNNSDREGLDSFTKQLTLLIHQYHLDTDLNMQDYILADLLTNMLIAYKYSKIHQEQLEVMKSSK